MPRPLFQTIRCHGNRCAPRPAGPGTGVLAMAAIPAHRHLCRGTAGPGRLWRCIDDYSFFPFPLWLIITAATGPPSLILGLSQRCLRSRGIEGGFSGGTDPEIFSSFLGVLERIVVRQAHRLAPFIIAHEAPFRRTVSVWDQLATLSQE